MRIFFFLCIFGLFAEEGMWTFNHLPLEQVKKNYGVELDQKWIDLVQKSSLRISLGGSGSFVSDKGLVLTNHHVGSRAIYNLSKEGRDLIENGFLAKTLADELICPNMYVDQLVSIRDVTNEVNATSGDEMTPAQRETARKEAMAEIKKKAQEESGLQPEIVSLYQGAIYNLYLYQRYTDVRLVMAPEKSIAFFGGDADNFEYPRYDLDICFFRVYENGKPLATNNYLKWSNEGPLLNEPIFVSGNPGRTRRMLTSAHLDFLKRNDFPLMLQWLQNRRKQFQDFAAQSAENKRIVMQDLFSCENSLKVYANIVQGFSDLPIIQNKKKEEKALQKGAGNEPWANLADALKKAKSYYASYLVLEGAGSNYSKLYAWAKQLVRLAEEVKKPNEQRLKEYTDSEIPAIELDILSTEPVYKSLENLLLAGSFERTIKVLGKKNPVSQLMLGKNTIANLLANTKLDDLSVRKNLYEHLDLVEKSSDPMILLAKAIDPYAREIRQKKEDELDSVQNESYAAIAKILFARYGQSVYPDATFTLRLSIGSMKGYTQDDQFIPPTTDIGGAFLHAKDHENKDPYQLPKSWTSKQNALDKTTPLNFVSTNDIIGGNSGSPVIDKNGALVGLIFDGNIQSIIWSFAYDDVQGRATSVHSSGILEALKKVYGATNLVKEIQHARAK